MNVVIYTSSPEAIDTDEIKTAIEDLGYVVLDVTIGD